MNETIHNMILRRSCKKYDGRMVPDEIIDKIIEAGLYAASANGSQNPIILAVTDKETRDKLSKLNSKYDVRKRVDPFYNAQVVLVVLAPKGHPTAVHDGSLVMGNLMLAAHSLGVDSCWIHRAKETFEDPEGIAILKSLGIEEEYDGVANCVLGYRDYEINPEKPRKDGRVFKI